MLFLISLPLLEISIFSLIFSISLSLFLICLSKSPSVVLSLPCPPKKFSTPPTINAPSPPAPATLAPIPKPPFIAPVLAPITPTAFLAAAPLVTPVVRPVNAPPKAPPAPPVIPPAIAPPTSPAVPATVPLSTAPNPFPASPKPNFIPKASSISFGNSLVALNIAIIKRICTSQLVPEDVSLMLPKIFPIKLIAAKAR